jgi:hypothetical protein
MVYHALPARVSLVSSYIILLTNDKRDGIGIDYNGYRITALYYRFYSHSSLGFEFSLLLTFLLRILLLFST